MPAEVTRLPLVFALPSRSDAPSGGNVYDRELTKALAELVPTRVTSFTGAEARLRAGEPGIYVFDTLDLEKIRALAAPRESQLLALVVHHLPSLEPGLAPDDPALGHEIDALPRFDLFVATSDFTREWLVTRGHAASAILTVPPGLPECSSPARAYEAPLRALIVANLVPRKGVLRLLEALAELELPALRLRIVGRGDVDASYAALCHRFVSASPSLGKVVRFDGPVPYESMGQAYDDAHLFVSASTMETFGMAILEARAHGLPVLARDGGYVRRHFEEGACGRLFESDAELAEALVALAKDELGMRGLFSSAQAARLLAPPSWSAAARTFLAELARIEPRARSPRPSRSPA